MTKPWSCGIQPAHQSLINRRDLVVLPALHTTSIAASLNEATGALACCAPNGHQSVRPVMAKSVTQRAGRDGLRV